MLAHPLEERQIDLADYAVEWKWDGIRAQLVHVTGQTRLYSRAGDDITGSFPDIASAFDVPAVLDGELLVKGDFQGAQAASSNAIKTRIHSKQVPAKALGDIHPIGRVS